MSFTAVQEQVKDLASRAIELDRAGQIDSAVFFYMEASQALVNFTQTPAAADQLTDSQRAVIKSKLHEYISRAELLKTYANKDVPHASLSAADDRNKVFPNIKSDLEVNIK
jgi:hypothetical protein